MLRRERSFIIIGDSFLPPPVCVWDPSNLPPDSGVLCDAFLHGRLRL